MHIITGLRVGGAETMLLKLIRAMDRDVFEPSVVSLSDMGALGAQIVALGVPVYTLDIKNALNVWRGAIRLRGIIRRTRPDLIQTWMYHSDLAGALVARLAGNPPVVWNIRRSDLSAVHSKRSYKWLIRLAALASRQLPAGIISCSERARDVHVYYGYRADKIVVIPNGFDLDRFYPDAELRAAVRAELAIPQSAQVVALIGRFDPQKDHSGFIEAAARVQQQLPACHFILCGAEITHANPILTESIEAHGPRNVHLLGIRDDMPRIYSAIDVLVSASSYGEGFPNVVGEAMSSAVPCIVTDVGESATIVGKTGRVVPPSRPDALAEAIVTMFDMPASERLELGAMARRRVRSLYSIEAIAASYQRYHETLIMSSRSSADTSDVD